MVSNGSLGDEDHTPYIYKELSGSQQPSGILDTNNFCRGINSFNLVAFLSIVVFFFLVICFNRLFFQV